MALFEIIYKYKLTLYQGAIISCGEYAVLSITFQMDKLRCRSEMTCMLDHEN